MLEGIALFLVGLGALLVSIVSMLHLAWLAVIIPLTVAGGAAYAIYSLGTRRARRVSLPDGREREHHRKSPRIAA
jgi:hypothetical protein